MKTNISLSRVIGAAIIAVSLVAVNVRSEDTTDAINLVRSIYKTDRQAFITEHMPLTATESANFWPLYREYRQDMEKLGDSLVKLVLEFADTYPDIPDKDAQRLLKDYMALFHPRFVGLTGDAAAIRQAARAYRVYYEKVEREDKSDYTLDHSAFIYLMDRDGRYLGFFPPGTSAERLAETMRSHLPENP